MRLARPIADALRRGATVVAASSRAARALHLGWAEIQRSEGRVAWPTPPVYDWDTWIRERWREHCFNHPESPALLSPLQEQALWTRALGDDAQGVVSPDAMAALAMQAWDLLSRYRAHPARRAPWTTSDASADAEHFRRWAAAFERACARHSWISSSLLEEFLAAAPDLPLPSEIWLVGFDRIHPATRYLLEAVSSRGVAIHEFAPTPDHPAREWVSASDTRQEIAACAAWIRSLLLKDPSARIGIIVPSVADLRGEIDRAFRRELMPQSEDIRVPAAPLPYEFALGQPLAEVPAIRAALLLLRWISAPLREESISWLLLSGFIGRTITYAEALARNDAAQRSSGLSPERSLAQYRASIAESPALRGLHERLGAVLLAANSRNLPGQQRPSVWAELVHHLLDRAGWPGLRPSDSVQFQAQHRWERLLDEIALLDFDGSACDFAAFLAALERQAQDTIFAPESEDAPIQIMGPAESSGQRFDAIWFMGADDTRWPARGRLHPLLPAHLQREFSMPHATSDDDANLARSITARLLASAPQIVFSYAEREKDAELRISPLIARLFPPDTMPVRAADWLGKSIPAPPTPLDEISDDSGLPAWPSQRVAGGADVLRRQAACAFQSFTVRRLAAQPLEKSEWGLSAPDRGNLLHRVMQRLFTADEPARIRTREDIVTAIDTKKIGAILEAHIEAALWEILPAQPADAWTQGYLAAEKRRLLTRIGEWLACEAARHPFTVEACEIKLPDVHIGELRMNLRADRIDLLPDGSRLLLDYKTGDVSTAAWFGERPAEPQLPLYAAFGNVKNLSGVLFAQIRAGETGFKGRVRDAQAQLMPEIKSTNGLGRHPWSDEMRNEWARVLQNLAAEFLQGEAAVAPRDARVCEQCHLQGLCRIAEQDPGVRNGEEHPDA